MDSNLIDTFHQQSSWESPRPHSERKVGQSRSDGWIHLDFDDLPEGRLSAFFSNRTSTKEMRPLMKIDKRDLGTFLKWTIGTHPDEDRRRVPSAGGLYPNQVFIAVKQVENLEKGFYRYDALSHAVTCVHADSDLNDAFVQDGLDWNLCFVIASSFDRSQEEYGLRGYRFCLLEAGHMAQNMLVAAGALGWASLPVGGFRDDVVNEKLSEGHKALYLLPVGQRA